MERRISISALILLSALSACGKKDKNEMLEVADPVGPMSEPIAETPVPVIKVPERIATQDKIYSPSTQGQQHAAGKVVIGIAVCDDFLNRYRACYADMPTNLQYSMKSGLDNTEKALQKLADEGDTKKLESACIQLEKGISQAMMAQGCPWN
ncbi:MAG: hypothetical protein K6L76_09750 [Agarilytica sp.]